MADQVTDYKCPACTGPLHFNGKSGKLECEYCGSTYDVSEIEKMYGAQDAAAAQNMADAEDEWEHVSEEWTEKGMSVYSCPSCGAELVVNDTTAATACPYCGNTTIVPGPFSGMMKPDCIIPFKLDKKDAVEKLQNFYKGKPLLPKAFTAGNHIEEVKGVYVPFWLYDGLAHARGIFEAQRSHSHEEGEYRVTVTEHYRVDREGDIAFEKIPADASSRMPDDLMDSIEPFDYSGLKEFSSAYLAGYVADKYDVDAEKDADRAVNRAKQSASNAMRADISGYNSVRSVRENISVKQGKISYAMFPVWLLSTKFEEQNFLFAMNGQSGKFVGSLPIDKKKAILFFVVIAAVLELLMAGFAVFTGESFTTFSMILQFLLIPFGVAAIVLGIMKAQMNNVAAASAARDYISGNGMRFTHRSDTFINRTVQRVHVGSRSSGGGAGAGRR